MLRYVEYDLGGSRVIASAFGFLTFIRQSGRPDGYGEQRILTIPSQQENRRTCKTIAERRESYCPPAKSIRRVDADAFRQQKRCALLGNPRWFGTYEDPLGRPAG